MTPAVSNAKTADAELVGASAPATKAPAKLWSARTPALC